MTEIEPDEITDKQVSAYREAYRIMCEAGEAGPDYFNAIRAGLRAAHMMREIEQRSRVLERPIRKALEQRTEPELHPINLDPYPGTVDEVADEIARFVLELEDGPARGVAAKVRDRLESARHFPEQTRERLGVEP